MELNKHADTVIALTVVLVLGLTIAGGAAIGWQAHGSYDAAQTIKRLKDRRVSPRTRALFFRTDHKTGKQFAVDPINGCVIEKP